MQSAKSGNQKMHRIDRVLDKDQNLSSDKFIIVHSLTKQKIVVQKSAVFYLKGSFEIRVDSDYQEQRH